MKTVRTIRDVTENQRGIWDRYVRHPLQTWAWGEFRKKTGVTVVRLAEFEGSGIVNEWQMTLHKIPHTPWTIGYIPKSSLPTSSLLEKLRTIGKENGTVFIQFEPNVYTRDVTTGVPAPLRPALHPLFTRWTFILDLTKPEADLLSAMHPKTRYNIKVARKNEVSVREDNTADAFESYLRLSAETTDRQAFYAHSPSYHRAMWESMRQAGIAHLFTATYAKKMLAAWILFVWHDCLYYPYGASSREHREVMAPTLLLWETALWGKKIGLSKYDLWGAMGPNPDTRDPYFGFHRFKEGFRPGHEEFIGSFDFVINPLAYHVYGVADRLRWKYLKLKKTFT